MFSLKYTACIYVGLLWIDLVIVKRERMLCNYSFRHGSGGLELSDLDFRLFCCNPIWYVWWIIVVIVHVGNQMVEEGLMGWRRDHCCCSLNWYQIQDRLSNLGCWDLFRVRNSNSNRLSVSASSSLWLWLWVDVRCRWWVNRRG